VAQLDCNLFNTAASNVASYAASSTREAKPRQRSIAMLEYATGRAEQNACDTDRIHARRCQALTAPSISSPSASKGP
jgi:hypothetical protein